MNDPRNNKFAHVVFSHQPSVIIVIVDNNTKNELPFYVGFNPY